MPHLQRSARSSAVSRWRKEIIQILAVHHPPQHRGLHACHGELEHIADPALGGCGRPSRSLPRPPLPALRIAVRPDWKRRARELQQSARTHRACARRRGARLGLEGRADGAHLAVLAVRRRGPAHRADHGARTCQHGQVSPSARLRARAGAYARRAQARMSLARLLQLASPTLPVGAYSYSQGPGKRRSRQGA